MIYLERFAEMIANKENLLLKQIALAFESASHLDSPARIQAEQLKADVLKEALQNASLDFNLTPEDRKSLAKTKFPDMKTGRGLAVAKILGGEDASAKFDQFCDTICAKSRFKFGDDRARGLRQFVADLFEVLVREESDPESHAKKVGRLNTRLLYSHSQFSREKMSDPNFAGELLGAFGRKELPQDDMATMPIDTPIKILIWLLADNNERELLLREATRETN